MKKIIFTSLTIILMSVIFIFSNQKAVASTNISNSFIDNTIIKLYRIFDKNITDEEQIEITKKFSRPIRKLAHFTVYFTLGFLVLYTLKSYNIKTSLVYYSILICFLYAMSDEFHQLFVLGRSGEFRDVTLDTLASSISIIIFNKKKPNKV